MPKFEGDTKENMDDDSGNSMESDLGTQSSSDSTNYNYRETLETFQFKTVAYQMVNDPTKYPAHIKSKEDKKIKDVVKELVLPFLPAKSLMRFRSVSKEWDWWIMSPFLAHKQSCTFQKICGFFGQYNNSDPTFVTLSPRAYGVPTPSLKFFRENVAIRSSCNGLLLCQGLDGDEYYYICNPANKQLTVLPLPEYYHGSEPAVVLAFEPSVLNVEANYQVICAVIFLDQPVVHFEIFSSETKDWRRSAADCIELRDLSLKSNGFYIKGIAYWLTSTNEVLAFDLKNNIAGTLHLPSESTSGGILTEMHGELCYICARDQQPRNLYMFDIYGGINMSLKCSISVDLETSVDLKVERITAEQCQILALMNDDVLIFLIGDTLLSYPMSHKTVTIISEGEINIHMRCVPYMNSLVRVA